MKRILLYSCTAFALFSCTKQGKDDTFKIIYEDQAKVVENAKAIKDKQPIKLINGLKIDLWASDSLLQDPVAIAVDDKGAIFVNSTNRNKASEFDIRGHRDWMTESIGFQTVEDRRSFLRRTFAPENSAKNTWLPDMNGDGSHDWLDLKVEKEEIYKVEDLNGDGYADQSTRVFHGFNEEITDVAGGLLVRKKDAFVAIGPDLMRLKHNNGQWKNPQSISTGYAVHIGFGGHGMSGLTEGPDGKIYWQIGDIGANITAKDGKKYKNPNSGVIVRSNPDGSEFEVYASGLRNTHEFVFDNYGNLISSDNDGDHPGESERLVHVVEGSDAGWRSNWQYGKYTDPRNNSYKVWMDEKLYVPRWEGQAAYIIPPIRNFHNGPTGMLWNPGTALGKRWTNKFFLVEFVGNANNSHIWSFDLKPKGASFDFKSEEDVVSGILPTGIRFGPEGALYASDWIFGWDTKNYGRIWKIDVNEKENDLKAEREQTKKYIQQDYSKQSLTQLYDLLFYADQRVRLKAQYELAERKAVDIFVKAVQQKENQLARVHGIWGLGQLKAAKAISPLLTDSDEEIIAQSLKVLGDLYDASAEAQMIPLIASSNPRVAFFAAQALGRVKSEQAIPALLKQIEKNADNIAKLGRGEAKRSGFILDTKAVGNMTEAVNLTGDIPRQYAPQVYALPNRKVHVRSLLPVGTISQGLFTFPQETGGEGAPANQTQGSAKAQVDFDISMVNAPAQVIAGYVKISRQMLDDVPAMTSFLQSRLLEKYLVAEDSQLLFGSGSGVNLQGITGVASAATGAATVDVEQLVQAIAQVENSNYSATGILINPLDWANIVNTKNTNAAYSLPGSTVVTTNGQLSIAGIPVYTSTAIAADKFLVGDWSMGAQIMQNQGISVQFSEMDSDNFQKNLITARIECMEEINLMQPTAAIYASVNA